MCTLLSMVYGLFKPYWLTHAICTCFRVINLLFNVHLSCFVDFILTIKKYINLLNAFKVKNKYRMISFWCFSYRLWPKSLCQCRVSAFNFEQVFVSRVWKTSHNVLKRKKRNKIVFKKNLQGQFYSAIYNCTEFK